MKFWWEEFCIYYIAICYYLIYIFRGLLQLHLIYIFHLVLTLSVSDKVFWLFTILVCHSSL